MEARIASLGWAAYGAAVSELLIETKRNMYGVRIDRFSSLDHLTAKQLADDETVLEVLRHCKRVSCFEMSGNAAVRSAVERLKRAGKIEITEMPYPWCGVAVNG